MENYILDGAAVLSKDDIAGTDSLIASALDEMPSSAVAGIMPITKIQGPTSQWVEPYFGGDPLDSRVELLSTQVIMDDDMTQKRLEFGCATAEDIRRMYTPEGFKSIVRGWMLFHKHSRQRTQLEELLMSSAVDNLPFLASGASLVDITDDAVESIKAKILYCITALLKNHQLGTMDFSVVGPFEASWPVLEVQTKVPGMLHFMGSDKLKHIYVFPTGTEDMSRAGVGLFEYADVCQRTTDSTTGEELYLFYNRSNVVLNPIHTKEPMVAKISLS